MNAKLVAIEDLEEIRSEALERTADAQAKRKEGFDSKLPGNHGIVEGILVYNNRHKQFLGKLHTRWMGPYMVTEVFPNGSLQLEDLQGV